MNFEEFQDRARLHVIGALDSAEETEFEEARQQFGAPADACIAECYRLHEAFALSLRPAQASEDLKAKLMAMVRDRAAKK